MKEPARKMRERGWIAPGAMPRLPFALRDLRDLCFQVHDKATGRPLFELIKQTTRGVWPTESDLNVLNAYCVEHGLPQSTCPTRDRVVPREPTEPTPAQLRAQAVQAYDDMKVARPLKPPASRAEYTPVPSEVLKLRAKDAHPDDFSAAFLNERLR